MRKQIALSQGPVQVIRHDVLERLINLNSPVQALASCGAQTGVRGSAAALRELYWQLVRIRADRSAEPRLAALAAEAF